jgi:hypothetical protein
MQLRTSSPSQLEATTVLLEFGLRLRQPQFHLMRIILCDFLDYRLVNFQTFRLPIQTLATIQTVHLLNCVWTYSSQARRRITTKIRPREKHLPGIAVG